ncbi:DUF1566 domain-containing protein [Rheinheimera sp.]|uniref:Lcl domain-containing protein n=1 Tax=Rheinheimera sp. TaxID=1869214 RepID=UPI00307DDDE1
MSFGLAGCGGGGGDAKAAVNYQVSASAGLGGSVSPVSVNVQSGQTVTFTLTAETGYSISAVSGCGGSLNGNIFTTAGISGACSVQASFSLDSYSLTASAGAGGSISPASVKVNHGQSTSFTLNPAAGYRIDSVTGCGGSLTGSVYTTANVTASCQIQASFASQDFVVTATASEGGTISPASQRVAVGVPAILTLTADPGYHIGIVQGCDGSLDAEQYRIESVHQDCTVTANFIADTYTSAGTRKLNDTGISLCASETQTSLPCPVPEAAGQDAEYGRDAQAAKQQLVKAGAGEAGFDFSKLGVNGETLPDDAAVWSCVRDNHTGLTWEVKTADGGLRDQQHRYSWYQPDPEVNGGYAGKQNAGQCSGSSCDTAAFVQQINQQGLCGHSDWRLPDRIELSSILYHAGQPPLVAPAYFPNTMSGLYWTAVPFAQLDDTGVLSSAWVVDFSNGSLVSRLKSSESTATPFAHLRLVRGGQ